MNDTPSAPDFRAPLDDDPEWAHCFHASGSEPGCASCWHGTAMRLLAELDKWRNIADHLAAMLQAVHDLPWVPETRDAISTALAAYNAAKAES